MIEIIGIFTNYKIKKTFTNTADASEFRDNLDAQYPIRVEWNYI